MTISTVTKRILQFNQGRQRDLLELKLENMCKDAFVFLRGACHLFYDEWPLKSALNDTPRVWLCGDLHLENFGSYQGENGLVYFDINDFDEAVLAPCTWDLARLLTSLLLGIGAKKQVALALGQVYLDAYCQALAAGRAYWIERETATGLVRELLDTLRARRRKDFLNKRTKVKGKQRRFRIQPEHVRPASDEVRAQLESFFKTWTPPPEILALNLPPDFFKLQDVARRVAGTGSLGVERYALLVEGLGSPQHNYLLDLKEARPSALLPLAHRLRVPQPVWPDEAARIVEVKKRLQAVPPLLTSVEIAGTHYVLGELQPTQDRVNLESCRGRGKKLRAVVADMGRLTAWLQVRGSRHQGSASVEELSAFARSQTWQAALLRQVQKCYEQTVTEHQAYRADYKRGEVRVRD